MFMWLAKVPEKFAAEGVVLCYVSISTSVRNCCLVHTVVLCVDPSNDFVLEHRVGIQTMLSD
jgi:hypothetical protein